MPAQCSTNFIPGPCAMPLCNAFVQCPCAMLFVLGSLDVGEPDVNFVQCLCNAVQCLCNATPLGGGAPAAGPALALALALVLAPLPLAPPLLVVLPLLLAPELPIPLCNALVQCPCAMHPVPCCAKQNCAMQIKNKSRSRGKSLVRALADLYT